MNTNMNTEQMNRLANEARAHGDAVVNDVLARMGNPSVIHLDIEGVRRRAVADCYERHSGSLNRSPFSAQVGTPDGR